MASANLVVTNTKATIESTTSQARITKDPLMLMLAGTLTNAGSTTTWIAINQPNSSTAVATTNAQAQGTIPLTAGASVAINPAELTIDHLSTGTTTLVWVPSNS